MSDTSMEFLLVLSVVINFITVLHIGWLQKLNQAYQHRMLDMSDYIEELEKGEL